MKALCVLSLVALGSVAVLATGSTPKKPGSKKETPKKENSGSDLHKNLFLEASNVKKAITERTEAAQAQQSDLFQRVRPVKDAITLNSRKSGGASNTRNRPAPAKSGDFTQPGDTKANEDALTTTDPLNQETDVPVLLSRSALLQLLNVSADNLEKELKTITVGSNGITIGGFDPSKNVFFGTGPGVDVGTNVGIKGGFTKDGVTIAFPELATKPILGLIGAGDKDGISATLATIFAVTAAIGAGIASLIAFVVPPLQIANQVLAIIAISLLIAYVVEDKKKTEEEPEYDYLDSGYTGYGYELGPGLVSFGDTTGYSSYSNYRRNEAFQPSDSFSDLVSSNTIDSHEPKPPTTLGRSVGLVPMVNSVAKAVSKAVTSYTNMYGDHAAS